jgi:glycosyltransferase involved in cell wall biosynthesis
MPIALYLSRLDPKKNVEGLLRAFASCVPGMPDVRLAIAGEGAPDYVESLHRLARDLGLGERVLWTGRLDGDVKAGAFAAATLFVLPSHSENFGIAAAEALMAGLPCVLGKGVAISGEVAAAGAGLSVTTEPQDIARALRELLADEARRAEMGRRAAVLAADRYSLGAMGARLAQLYEEIAGK